MKAMMAAKGGTSSLSSVSSLERLQKLHGNKTAHHCDLVKKEKKS